MQRTRACRTGANQDNTTEVIRAPTHPYRVDGPDCRPSRRRVHVNPRRMQRISVQDRGRIAHGTSSEVFVLIDIPVDFDRLMPARRRWPSGQSNCCSDILLSLGSCGLLHAQRTADVLRLHGWFGVRMGRFSQSLHSAGLDHCAVNGVCRIEIVWADCRSCIRRGRNEVEHPR